MSDYLYRGTIADLDPDLGELLQIEAERQFRKLILIPSESTAPIAVRNTLVITSYSIHYTKLYDKDRSKKNG